MTGLICAVSDKRRSPKDMAGQLDPAFAALLSDPRVALRRPPPGISIDEVRVAANRFLAKAPRPQIHSAVDYSVGTLAEPLTVRLYRPSSQPGLPIILFVHGGGFILGNLETHDAMARELANRANAVIVAVDYRLAPEYPFPAALDDCMLALEWVIAEAAALNVDPTRVSLAGDSAGGQLAVATALRCSGSGTRPRHVALLYPLLDPHRANPSARTLDEDYMLTGSFIEWAWSAYRGRPDVADSPLFDVNHAVLENFPPTTIVTAQFDPLRDEGEAFSARLERAGVPVELKCYEGMIHGFAGFPHLTPIAHEAIDFLAQRLASSFAG